MGPVRCHFGLFVDTRLREIVVSGEFDAAAAPVLAAAIERFHNIVGRSDLTIVLEGVTFIDAAGIGAVAAARRYQVERGLRLGVAGMTPKVCRVFDLAQQGALLDPLPSARVTRLHARAAAAPSSAPGESVAGKTGSARPQPRVAKGVRPGDADVAGAVDDQLKQLSTEVENLRFALQASRRIGIAIGIVMNAHRLTDGQAFDVLARLSQQKNMKLRDLVEDIVLTGDIGASAQQQQVSL